MTTGIPTGVTTTDSPIAAIRADTIGFLGGGHMGRALVAALRRQGHPAARIIVGEPAADARVALERDFGVRTTADNLAVAETAGILVLAVKPQDMASALQPLQATLSRRRPLIVSIAAGLTVGQLRALCGAGAAEGAPLAVARAMPNRPALSGLGATGLYAPPDVPAEARTRTEAVLGAAGMVAWIDIESLMDAVTAVSGSGPAYFFRLAEALADAGRAQGLPADVATRLAAATLAGAGAMAAADTDLAGLRAAVTSRGGTTAAALATFEAGGLERLVAEAVESATRRGRELAQAAQTAPYGTVKRG
ncbi:MAG: pyrroline-5-carboxylate reductase [Planctomycetota bacterium]